jgi:nucleotide-binding universal stress UspA family protein
LKPGVLPSEKVFRRILVAIDGSDVSFRAGKYAVRLAKRNEAELIVVSVIQTRTSPLIRAPIERPDPQLQRYYKYASKNAEQWLNKEATLARSQEVDVTVRVLKGTSVVKAITDCAAHEEVDLIVVGRRGIGGFKRLRIGSVSNGVLNHAANTVLVVK